MFFFTDWIPESETQYLLGWSMLGIIFLCVVINLLIMIFVVSGKVCLLCKKAGKLTKRWWLGKEKYRQNILDEQKRKEDALKRERKRER